MLRALAGLATLTLVASAPFPAHALDAAEAEALATEAYIFGYPLADDTYATSEKALQEAMWVGVPPVVFPHGGVRDLVVHEDTGLVVTSAEAYTDALDRLAGDRGLRERLGSTARRFARTEFDPARWWWTLNGLLHSMMDKPRKTRDSLPGANESAAENFVRSLGDQSGPFAEALAKPESAAAQAQIAAVSAVLANGEGGIAHYCNTFPDDPHLRAWAQVRS